MPTEVTVANARAKKLKASVPTAIAARYDKRADRIVLSLSSKLEVMFAPKLAQGLEDASPTDLAKIEISPSGYGIHFPRLDADLYLPALLEGFLGSKKWMAARLGAAGGSKTSEKKSAAARANGLLGGRPRKVAGR
ncbi:MAG: DUF2442 domain-containing protein [Granulicella sp.]